MGEKGRESVFSSQRTQAEGSASIQDPFERPFLDRLIVVTLIIVISFIADSLLDEFLPEPGSFILMIGVVLATRYGGRRLGFTGLGVSALGLDYFYLDPTMSFKIQSVGDQVRMLAYLITGAVAVELTARLYDAFLAAERSQKEAEKAVQVREDILNIVSHDLKTPLTSLILCLNHTSKLLTQSQIISQAAPMIIIMRKSALQIQNLIANLLDFGRLQKGKLTLNLGKASVEKLVEDITQIVGPVASAKNISIKTEAATNGAVYCDSNRILQVLQNVLGNAIKFTPEGHTILLNAEEVGGEVIFAVSDQGPGIAPEELPHIFDRFWQKKGSNEGSGLGLYITKEIVEAHNGRVWAESRLGKGTRIFIAVPRVLQPGYKAESTAVAV